MIVSSWNGGQSQDVLIKRKRLEYDSNGLYDQSDFKKRKSHAFARKALKDSRPSSDFSINSDGLYTDDLNKEFFEIYTSEDDGRSYLVFLLSIFKVSLAYDEDIMMREVELGLTLHPDIGTDAFFASQE